MTNSRAIRATTAFVVILSLAGHGLFAQTLARPGWVGSGLTAQTWFRHAIFYRIDTRTFQDTNGDGTGDLKGITQHLEYIHSLGVDAVLLESLGLTQAGAPATSPNTPIDPALGTLDDFDELTLQASRLKIRVLVELPAPDPALARFWLNRGVAGFYVPGSDPAKTAGLQAIRKLLPSYVGQRVLMTDAGAADATSPKSSSNELLLDQAVLNAAASGSVAPAAASSLRPALEHSQALSGGTTVFAISGVAAADPNLSRIALAAVLLNRSAALITAGQELGAALGSGTAARMPWGQAPVVAVEKEEAPEPPKPAAPMSVPDKYTPYVPYVRPVAPKKPVPPDPATAAGQELNTGSLLNFYRRLSLLHHGGSAIHDGEEVTLNYDAQSALIWVRRPASSSLVNPPIVIACNLTGKPVVLSLRADMARLQLHGTFLRTLLRSDDAMGGTSIDPLTVPAYGVYVGELRR